MKKHLTALLGATLVAGGLGIAAEAAAAATAPSEVTVVPAPTYPTLEYPTDSLAMAGRTGFLHRRTTTSPWLWTRYADRHTVVVEALNGVATTSVGGIGGDFLRLPPDPNSTTINTLDLSTMTRRALTVPADASVKNVYGNTMIVARPSEPSAIELRRFAADGTDTTTSVTGVPEDATGARAVGGDDRGAILQLQIPGKSGRYAFVDFASAKATLMPALESISRVVLTDDHVGMLVRGKASVFSRDGVDLEPRVITPPTSAEVGTMALAGEDLVALAPSGSDGQSPVLRYTADGGAPTQIGLAPSDTSAHLRQAPDGVLVVGGTKSSDWAVRKVTAAGQSIVVPLSEQVNAGVTLSSGMLRHVAAVARPGERAEYRFHDRQVGPGTGPSPGYGSELVTPIACASGATCVRLVDGYSGGPSYLSAGSSISLRSTTTEFRPGLSLPSADGVVVDASREYRLVNGINPARQYLVGTDDNIVSTTPVTGAALWYSTLWTASTPGNLQPKNLDTGVLGTAVGTGSACTAAEVQATGWYVFWSCGPAGPTGVYDLARKQNIPVPAGQYLLGDNYLVRHDASGDLLRYDLTDGTLGEAVTLATRPRGDLPDDRNITWAVDKFDGDVAWVDEDNAVHIVDPGVAPSGPVTIKVSAPQEIDLPTPFSVTAELSRPVHGAPVTLTLTQLRTGKVITGTADVLAGKTANASWNGLVDGRPATRGNYRWTLTSSIGGTSTAIADGTVLVMRGAPVLHGYNYDSGQPDLLGLTSAATGSGQWLTVKPGGTALVKTGGDTEALTPITAVVPFGDITKDNRNDLLIRRADGSMRAFRGDDVLPFTGNTLTAVAGNWNRWDALVHTGDLTGDGQSDLIARDRATGGLYRIDGDGAGGFRTPVLWATGYKGYTRFVGPGDINGDGKADLLLFVGTDMYAKYGDGKGGLGDRRLVGSGFLGYDAIVGIGDLNEDGNNDLLLRDTAGNLYRRLGNGAGDFGNRLLIGTGYQKYASIY